MPFHVLLLFGRSPVTSLHHYLTRVVPRLRRTLYGLETVVSVLFSNIARAYCTMNEKFSILHEAKLSAVLKISSSLYSKQVRVFENKTRTNSL